MSVEMAPSPIEGETEGSQETAETYFNQVIKKEREKLAGMTKDEIDQLTKERLNNYQVIRHKLSQNYESAKNYERRASALIGSSMTVSRRGEALRLLRSVDDLGRQNQELNLRSEKLHDEMAAVKILQNESPTADKITLGDLEELYRSEQNDRQVKRIAEIRSRLNVDNSQVVMEQPEIMEYLHLTPELIKTALVRSVAKAKVVPESHLGQNAGSLVNFARWRLNSALKK